MVTTSYGGCTKPGETSVNVSGLRAEIRPYNRWDLTWKDLWGGRWCPLVARAVTRRILLRFDSQRVATIRIIGRGGHGQEVIHERQVEVKQN